MPSEVSTARAAQNRGGTVEELERELSEARRRETATAEVLRVIGSSPTDVQPVFDTIVTSAVKLCHGLFSALFQFDGELIHQVAQHNYSAEAFEEVRRAYPRRPSRARGAGRAILERAVVHIPDIEFDPEYEHSGLARVIGFRSGLWVPMLRQGAPVGVVLVTRATPGPFSDSEIELLKTFADQAVIAIENTRLFEAEQARTKELTEALERQTASAEVLNVISSSPGDLQPVFEAMLSNAVRICEAKFGNLLLYEGDVFRFVAMYGAPPAFAELRRRNPVVPAAGSLARIAATKQVQHVADIKTVQSYLDRNPATVALADAAGARTLLGVPMVKDDELIGVIGIYRQEVRPFTDKQIDLVTNFACQAVITIENTRLLNELRDSLQQQTATADVLKVISRATFDLPRVLDTLIGSAASLCDSDDTAILQRDDEVLRVVSHRVPAIDAPTDRQGHGR